MVVHLLDAPAMATGLDEHLKRREGLKLSGGFNLYGSEGPALLNRLTGHAGVRVGEASMRLQEEPARHSAAQAEERCSHAGRPRGLSKSERRERTRGRGKRARPWVRSV